MGIIEPKNYDGDSSNIEEIRRNKWFSLKKIKPSNFLSIIPIFNKINYVIVLHSDPPKVIAEDDNIDQINCDWNWAHSIIQKDMSFHDFLHFIESKAIAMKQFNSEIKKKMEETESFLQTFGFNDSSICKYRCSILKTGPIPGILYVTNYCIAFCFTLNINSPIILRYKDISFVERTYVLNFMKALKITDDFGDYYTFTALSDRDDVYNIINYLWYSYMDKILTIEDVNISKSFIKRKKKSFNKDKNGKVYNTINDTYTNLLQNQITSPKQLRKSLMNNKLVNQFRYPKMESIQYRSECTLKIYSPRLNEKCLVIITEHFLSFISDNMNASIPFFDITAIHYDHLKTIKIFSPCITAEVIIERQKKASRFYSISESFFNMAKKLFKHVNKNTYLKIEQYERTRQLVSLTRDRYVVSNQSSNNSNELNWSEYCFNFFEGFSLIYSTSFANLIEKGILHSLRGIMWQVYSGSMYHKIIYESKGYYQKLLLKSEQLKSSSDKIDLFEDIEKDLQRSFPEHPFYQTENGINSLRNVLVALALHNEDTGYCQSMNIICSILLLYMSEESSFYLMNVICDIIMKRNFSKSMSGAVINQNIFEQLLKLKLPHLYMHLKSNNVPIKAIIMPWLLCMFVDCLPLDTVLRILDLFFLYGIKALFQAGLAIFYLKENSILKTNDSYDITHLLREDLKIQSDLLVNTMKEKFSDIDDEIILKYKLHLTHKYTKNVANTWRQYIFETIKEEYSLNITLDVFDEAYNSYIDITKSESDILVGLTEDQYMLLMNKYEWFKKLSSEEQINVLNLTNRDKHNKIHLGEILKDLYNWIYSGRIGKFNFCLKLKGLTDVEKLYYDEVIDVIDVFFRIENISINPQELIEEMLEDLGIELQSQVDVKTVELYVLNSIMNDEKNQFCD